MHCVFKEERLQYVFKDELELFTSLRALHFVSRCSVPFGVENICNAILDFPHHNLQGTKMVFAGLKKESDRKDLIAYLKSTCSPP